MTNDNLPPFPVCSLVDSKIGAFKRANNREPSVLRASPDVVARLADELYPATSGRILSVVGLSLVEVSGYAVLEVE